MWDLLSADQLVAIYSVAAIGAAALLAVVGLFLRRELRRQRKNDEVLVRLNEVGSGHSGVAAAAGHA